MNSPSLTDLVARVTEYSLAHDDERDCWEKAVALTGILTWGDEPAIQAAQAWVDRAVATQNTEGNLSYADTVVLPAGHARTFTPTAPLTSSIGYPLLRYYERTGRKEYLDAAKLQIDALMNTPRTADGGFIARREAPELWIDMVYLMCPFLVLYGQITGDQAYIDEAMRQYEVHTARLVDSFAHLPRHAWCERPNHFPQSTFWARGNGWLIAAAVDLYTLLDDHPKRDAMAAVGIKALEVMAGYQDRSGYFHHILDDGMSKKEASATLMFAYAAARAVKLGLADASLLEKAVRAFRVVAGSVAQDGAVPGVAVPPGGPGVPFGSTPFGQGFFLLAAYELRDQLT